MLDTIGSMIVSIVVLLILGSLIIGLAWWLAVQAEGKDEWLFGSDTTDIGTATVIGRRDPDGVVTIVHSSFERVGEGTDGCVGLNRPLADCPKHRKETHR